MPWVDVDQNSVDWLHMRCGSVTASHLCDVLAKMKRIKKAKEGEPPEPPQEHSKRRNYRRAKIRENLTLRSMETYVSPYMEAGSENETLALAAYEMQTGYEVTNGGLYIHDSIPRFMASPDGRVRTDGLFEAKYLTGTTTEANHEELVLGDADVPEEYQLQMQGQLACAPERHWVDFCSHDPEMPKSMKTFIKRFYRDEKMISAIELEVVQFLEEVVAQLKRAGQKDIEFQRPNLASILERSVAEVAR